jgi:hypothetical protein
MGINRRTVSTALQIILMVVSVLTALTAISSFFNREMPLFTRAPTQAELEARVLERLDTDTVSSVANELANLRAEVDALTTLPETAPVNTALQRINGRINALDNRMSAFEEVISDDPLKALQIANLDRDLKNVQEQLTLDSATLNTNIARLYNQNITFIVLIISTLVTLIGFQIASFLRRS